MTEKRRAAGSEAHALVTPAIPPEPNVIRDGGFHRGRDAQALMDAAEASAADRSRNPLIHLDAVLAKKFLTARGVEDPCPVQAQRQPVRDPQSELAFGR